MGKLIDEIGNEYGEFTVEKRAGSDKHGNALWELRTPNEIKGYVWDDFTVIKSGKELREREARNLGKPESEQRGWHDLWSTAFLDPHDYQDYDHNGNPIDPFQQGD